MKAKLIMNPHPMTLRPTDTVATAAERILKHHLRHLPVIDEQGRYLGTFSVYSLLKLTLPKAVLDKHGLDNVSFVTESLDDLAQRLGGRRDEPVKDWLNRAGQGLAECPRSRASRHACHENHAADAGGPHH